MLEWISSNAMLVMWIFIAVAAVVFEAMTVALVSVWFIVGAVAGGIVALCGGPIWLQVVLAIAATTTSCVFVRKYAINGIKRKPGELECDDFKGLIESKRGVVSQTIPAGGKGQISVDGSYWIAQAVNDTEEIAEGTNVVIYKVDGTTCIVAKVET